MPHLTTNIEADFYTNVLKQLHKNGICIEEPKVLAVLDAASEYLNSLDNATIARIVAAWLKRGSTKMAQNTNAGVIREVTV